MLGTFLHVLLLTLTTVGDELCCLKIYMYGYRFLQVNGLPGQWEVNCNVSVKAVLIINENKDSATILRF